MSEQPLLDCPDFSERAKRHENWWKLQNSRPLLLAKGLSKGEQGRSRHFDKLTHPHEWLIAKQQALKNTLFLADSLPYIHLDLGASVLAGLLGARVTYEDDHAWIAPTFSDWQAQPEMKLDSQNKLSNQLDRLLKLLIPELAGKALLMSPNLGGGADALMNLMGAEKICQSLIDYPEEVHSTLDEIAAVWRAVYANLMDVAARQQVGMIHWCELWSNTPYLLLECELAALVSRKHFQQFLAPDILGQAETVERTIYHICGEESFRHLDAVLEIPGISAIQYVPGKGNRALNKFDYLKKIQQHGLPLQIAVSPDEPRDLMKVLDSAGLCFLVLDALPMDQLENFTHLATP
ncbi:MAG: hypothetical protein WCG34_06880 [Leptolinea sp.]